VRRFAFETVMHHELQHCVASFVNQHGMVVQLEKMKQQQKMKK